MKYGPRSELFTERAPFRQIVTSVDNLYRMFQNNCTAKLFRVPKQMKKFSATLQSAASFFGYKRLKMGCPTSGVL